MKNINIKGKKVLTVCSLLVVSIIFACCCFNLKSITQPATATVGQEFTVKLDYAFEKLHSGDDPKTAFGIVGILAPKGWNLRENATLSYTSSKGDGTLKPMPVNAMDNANPGFTYAEAMMKNIGLGPNLVNDMEWIPFQTVEQFIFKNDDNITGVITIKINPGADGNDAIVKMGYVIASTNNGIDVSSEFIQDCGSIHYYSEKFSDILTVTGGTTGDLVDFVNPQYSFIDPPKALDNDFVTINFDANAGGDPSALVGESEVYFCGSAVLEDGSKLDVCGGSKALLKKYADNKYRMTIWPRSFFGLSATQKVVSLEYFITDQSGAKKVGKGKSSTDPFVIKFKCQ